MNKRLFPRSKAKLEIKFDLVKWNENRVDRCKNKFETKAFDISAQGVGLSDLPKISESVLNQLYTGKKKVRLTFILYPDHNPINTFARLVWDQQQIINNNENQVFDKKVCGFEFIDIPRNSFEEIKSYVDHSSD